MKKIKKEMFKEPKKVAKASNELSAHDKGYAVYCLKIAIKSEKDKKLKKEMKEILELILVKKPLDYKQYMQFACAVDNWNCY